MNEIKYNVSFCVVHACFNLLSSKTTLTCIAFRDANKARKGKRKAIINETLFGMKIKLQLTEHSCKQITYCRQKNVWELSSFHKDNQVLILLSFDSVSIYIPRSS